MSDETPRLSDIGPAIPALDAPDDLGDLITMFGDMTANMLDGDRDSANVSRDILLDRSLEDVYLAGLHYCHRGFAWLNDLGHTDTVVYGTLSDIVPIFAQSGQFPVEFSGSANGFTGVGVLPHWIYGLATPVAATVATVATVARTLVHEIARAANPELNPSGDIARDIATFAREALDG